jgi:hypothetical protein
MKYEILYATTFKLTAVNIWYCRVFYVMLILQRLYDKHDDLLP